MEVGAAAAFISRNLQCSCDVAHPLLTVLGRCETFLHEGIEMAVRHHQDGPCGFGKAALLQWARDGRLARPAAAVPRGIAALHAVCGAEEFADVLAGWGERSPEALRDNAPLVADLVCTELQQNLKHNRARRRLTSVLLQLRGLWQMAAPPSRVVTCLVWAWKEEASKWAPDGQLLSLLEKSQIVLWRPGLDDLFDPRFSQMADAFLIHARLHLRLPTEVVFLILAFVDPTCSPATPYQRVRSLASRLLGGWLGR
eukprot:EG_transcript_10570